MLESLGVSFPVNWLWGEYEKEIFGKIKNQIKNKYSESNNLLINLTWFYTPLNQVGTQRLKSIQDNLSDPKINHHFNKIDNLFLLATVDPPGISRHEIEKLCQSLGNPKLFKLGNFSSPWEFNFFAIVLNDRFFKYTESELILEDCQWLYLNYNRKPRTHRVEFVNQLIAENLLDHGVVTMGKPNRSYDTGPHNNLYLSLGEKNEDYVEAGHWYNLNEDEFGIPHDVLSLHNMKYWQHHFLNIVGATEFDQQHELFVSESQWKPIIGLRPFLVNGNPQTYKWLTNNGFKIFNHWFPGIDFDDPTCVHESLVAAIKYLTTLSRPQIISMYHDMLPDLRYNRARFFEFAQEQTAKMQNIFIDAE
jgi:hypothetical protein